MNYVLLAIFVFGGFSTLNADVIFLRNGQTVEGKIVTQTRSVIRIQTSAGLRTLNKDIIQRIVYGKQVPERQVKESRKKTKPETKTEKIKPAWNSEEIQKEIEKLRKESDQAREEPARDNVEASSKEPEKKAPLVNKEDPHEKVDAIKPTREGTLWRSLLLPGWGHYYLGQNVKGLAIAGSFLASIYGVYEYNRLYRNEVRFLQSTANPSLEEFFFLTQIGINPIPAFSELQNPFFFSLYSQPFQNSRAVAARQLNRTRASLALAVLIYSYSFYDSMSVWNTREDFSSITFFVEPDLAANAFVQDNHQRVDFFWVGRISEW